MYNKKSRHRAGFNYLGLYVGVFASDIGVVTQITQISQIIVASDEWLETLCRIKICEIREICVRLEQHA